MWTAGCPFSYVFAGLMARLVCVLESGVQKNVKHICVNSFLIVDGMVAEFKWHDSLKTVHRL